MSNQRQIEQMCSFILQEAREKAREIQIKVGLANNLSLLASNFRANGVLRREKEGSAKGEAEDKALSWAFPGGGICLAARAPFGKRW